MIINQLKFTFMIFVFVTSTAELKEFNGFLESTKFCPLISSNVMLFICMINKSVRYSDGLINVSQTIVINHESLING